MRLALGRAIARIWRGHLTTLPENLQAMKLRINGAELQVDDRHARTPLPWVLRDVLGMQGTKFGCGVGYCAACTVLLDGRTRNRARPRLSAPSVSRSSRSREFQGQWWTQSATRGIAATSSSAATVSLARRWLPCRYWSQTRHRMQRRIAMWMTPGTAGNASVLCMAYNSRP